MLYLRYIQQNLIKLINLEHNTNQRIIRLVSLTDDCQ